MKIRFQYPTLVFFYAFLRQADLSLDRVRWTVLDDLRAFYAEQNIYPHDLMAFLEKHAGDILADTNLDAYTYDHPAGGRIIGVIKRMFGNPSLTAGDVNYCYALLKSLDACLKGDVQRYTTETETLRVQIARFVYDHLEYKLKRKHTQLAVSHFYEYRELPPLTNYKSKELAF